MSGKGLLKWLGGVLALLMVSGTAPFWWKYIFPETPAGLTTPAGPTIFAGPMGEGEPGVSYLGGTYRTTTAQSGQACAKICQDDGRCLAMTFVHSKRDCQLKDKLTGGIESSSKESPDVISARRVVGK